MKTGWLIERKKDDRVEFACASDEGFFWSQNSGDAIAFLDRKSADQVSMILGDDADAIKEHEFGAEVQNPANSSVAELWLEAAHRHYSERKEMPVVLNVPIYSYFGSSASIVDINIYGPGGAECTVEGTFGETATVEREELNLATKYRRK